jgi:hypothetical protein
VKELAAPLRLATDRDRVQRHWGSVGAGGELQK